MVFQLDLPAGTKAPTINGKAIPPSNGSNRMAGHVAEYLADHQKQHTDPASNINGMPPNFGQFPLPHFHTFQGQTGNFARTYRASDEALKHSRENSRFMRNDPGIMECLEQRQRTTALLDWHIKPEDTEDKQAVELASQVERIVRRIRRFTEYRRWLLEAVWFGRAAVQHRYGYEQIGGRQRLIPKPEQDWEHPGWLPIHGDKLVFRYDDGNRENRPEGALGVLAGTRYKQGSLINDYWKLEATDRGLAQFIPPSLRHLLCVHKHMIEDGAHDDQWGGGQIHGVGIRSRIYWDWFQKQEMMAFLMSYLERSAGGIEIWSYPAGDAAAKTRVETAAKERLSDGRNVVFFPRPMGAEGDMYDVQVIEPGLAGIDILQNLLTDYYGHRIKRYILGQILTSESEATGLGSGVADLHLDTYMLIIKYDATNLEETLTHEMLRPIQLLNFPSTGNTQLRFKIRTESPDVQQKLESWRTAWDMGVRLNEADVMDMIGASVPDEGERALENPAIAMAAAGGDPMNPGADVGGFQSAGAAVAAPEMSPEEKAEASEGMTAEVSDELRQQTLFEDPGERVRESRGAEHYAKDDGQHIWRTIGGHEDGDKKHAGGQAIKIDSATGDIVGGPKWLADKGIDNTGEFHKLNDKPKTSKPSTDGRDTSKSGEKIDKSKPAEITAKRSGRRGTWYATAKWTDADGKEHEETYDGESEAEARAAAEADIAKRGGVVGEAESEDFNARKSQHTRSVIDAAKSADRPVIQTMTHAFPVTDANSQLRVGHNGGLEHSRNGRDWNAVVGSSAERFAASVGVQPFDEVDPEISKAVEQRIKDDETDDAKDEEYAQFVNDHFGGDFGAAVDARDASDFDDSSIEDWMDSVRGPDSAADEPQGVEFSEQSTDSTPVDSAQTSDEIDRLNDEAKALRNAANDAYWGFSRKAGSQAGGDLAASTDAAKKAFELERQAKNLKYPERTQKAIDELKSTDSKERERYLMEYLSGRMESEDFQDLKKQWLAGEFDSESMKEESTLQAGEQTTGVDDKSPDLADESTEQESIVNVSPSDLSYDRAFDAHRMSSFVPEKRAKQRQQEFADHINSVAESFRHMAETPEQMAVLKLEMQRYKQGYLQKLNAMLDADSRTASSMITGGSNFPTRRNQKRLDTARRRLDELIEFDEKARRSIARTMKESRSPEQVQADSTKAATGWIDDNLNTIKGIDSGDSIYTRSAFTNSIAGKLERMANNGEYGAVKAALEYLAEHNNDSGKPVFTSRHKVWDYHNKAKEVAHKQRAQIKSGDAIQDALTFDGANVERDSGDGRTRIYFDAIPSADVRQQLKLSGWRWSPSNKAWQRKDTDAAVSSARSILSDHFGEPIAENKPATVDAGEFERDERIIPAGSKPVAEKAETADFEGANNWRNIKEGLWGNATHTLNDGTKLDLFSVPNNTGEYPSTGVRFTMPDGSTREIDTGKTSLNAVKVAQDAAKAHISGGNKSLDAFEKKLHSPKTKRETVAIPHSYGNQGKGEISAITAKTHKEYKGYRIVSPFKGVNSIVNRKGEVVGQFAGINGATAEIDAIKSGEKQEGEPLYGGQKAEFGVKIKAGYSRRLSPELGTLASMFDYYLAGAAK